MITIATIVDTASAAGYTTTHRKDGLWVLKDGATVVAALYPTKSGAVSRIDVHGQDTDAHVAAAISGGATRKKPTEVTLNGAQGQAYAVWLDAALAARAVKRTTATGPKPADAPKAEAPKADPQDAAKARRDAGRAARLAAARKMAAEGATAEERAAWAAKVAKMEAAA